MSARSAHFAQEKTCEISAISRKEFKRILKDLKKFSKKKKEGDKGLPENKKKK